MRITFRAVLTFLTVLFSSAIAGQTNNTDSLLNLFNHAKVDTTRFEVATQLASYYLYKNPDSSLYFAQEAVKLATKQGDEIRTAKAYSFVADAESVRGGIKQALISYNKAIDILKMLRVGASPSKLKTIAKVEGVILGHIGVLYKSQSDFETAEKYYLKAYNLFSDIQDEEALAGIIGNIGTIHNQKGEFLEAIDCFKKALTLCKKYNFQPGIASALSNLSNSYLQQGKYTEANQYAQESLAFFEKNGNKKAQAGALSTLGSIALYQGDYPSALKYFFKSLKLYELLNIKQGVAINYVTIGQVYQMQKDYTHSMEYYKLGLNTYKEINNDDGEATCYANMANVVMEQKKYGDALHYNWLALAINLKNNKQIPVAINYSNIGLIYKLQGDSATTHGNNTYAYEIKYPLALEYYSKSQTIANELGAGNQNIRNLINISDILLIQKKYSKAEPLLNNALRLSIEEHSLENLKDVNFQLSKLYESTNRASLAFKHYKNYILYKDSLTNEEQIKQSLQQTIQFSYDKKAAADSVRSAEAKKVAAAKLSEASIKLKQERTQRFVLYGGIILVLAFAGVMFNRFKVTQKQKTIIELKEKETQLQKHVIEEKHKEITDSINYAERIQRSFIATKELLDANLSSPGGGAVGGGGYFVLFKPKDVVSGDFYWAANLNSHPEPVDGNNSQLSTPNSELFYLATADSTGHGVPGAIMSLLNITSLEKATEHHTDPAEILSATRRTIIERLKKDGSPEGGKDGMDCSLLCFDFKSKILKIAAANNPVWIVRATPDPEFIEGSNNGDSNTSVNLIEIKPDKMPVGKHDKDQQPFTTHTIELKDGDVIYTLTDGFPDQFGGENGKKFMSKKLKELLVANSHLSMNEQKELLEITFKNWVGNLEQVDDVTIIGVRI